MALTFELAGAQIDGAREYQEDAFLITNLTDADGNPSALVIVADGMGGHAAGNVASNMAVQAFNKHVSANYPAAEPADILHECVLRANKSIKDTVGETPALSGMGCTMVAAILESGKLWWASVGDSHVYLLRNKELIKKNADHSYGGFLDRMIAAGTPVEPEPGLARNMLMSAVTGDEINEIDVPQEPFLLQAGDRILLASDGLDTLSDGKVIQYSEWSKSPKECAEALLKAVEEAKMPKQDNTTVVIVNVVEKAKAAPAPIPVAAAPAPAPAAYVPAPAMPEPAFDLSEKKSNTGLILGIAAAVVVLVGAGLFFAGGGKKTAPAPAEVVETETTSDEIAPVAEETAEPEAAEAIPQEGAEPAEASTGTEPAETAAAPAAAPVPIAAAAPGGKEFSDKLKDGTPGPTMISIPAGTFEMGSPGSSRYADERPRRTVKASPFAIGKYEVTLAQYEKFAKATGKKVPDNLYLDKETHPTFFVSWDDAFYYTKWLSEQTGKKYRLPSEAEWEYAAGAAQKSPFWWGFEELPNVAHCFGCATGFDPRKPTKIGSFKPNQLGVYDTAGNVAEWVQDCWHENYSAAPAEATVWEGGDCAYRVARGGAFSSPPQSIRHAKRDRYKSDAQYDHIGFRVVREE